MTPSRTKITFGIITLSIIIIIAFLLWQGHTADIKSKLDYQEKYPYSCAVSNTLWDTCVTTGDDGSFGFAENQTCMSVYYAVVDFDNHHIYTYDSDGIVHFRGSRYDSNNVYHESSEYIECQQRGFA